jgi:hypothetical protein
MKKDTVTSIKTESGNFSSLEKSQLIDLLQHKTELLVTATLGRNPDKEYIRLIRKEVEEIQHEIKKRMG